MSLADMRAVGSYLAAWWAVTFVACLSVFSLSHIDEGPLPDAEATRWAYAALAAARSGDAAPTPPESAQRFVASGPIFVSVYLRGELKRRFQASDRLLAAVRDAADGFAHDSALSALPGWSTPESSQLRVRIAVTRGEGPLFTAIPGLSLLALVPLREGLAAHIDKRNAYLTPDEIWSTGAYDHAVDAPVPDLSFGTDIARFLPQLAEQLGVSTARLNEHSLRTLRRLRVDALEAHAAALSVTDKHLLQGARDAARFVLRHQARSGRFAYIYDARRDRVVSGAGYSMPRHAGATFFLAQAAAQLAMPDARAGALRAFDYLRSTSLASCGSDERLCVTQDGDPEVGGSALAALAAAQLLRSGDDRDVRELLVGLTAFLRAQQRPDGELMHEYDRMLHRPIDVQHMYYSGEAAMAFLRAYEVLGDARDLEAARKLMAHLTGAGWSFFGSRYFYGEEHWTCQAVGAAAAHMDVSSALEFCLRWARWQAKLQYRVGETPWPAQGAFGVGPVLLPRTTTAASRIEASVPVYAIARARQKDVADLRAVIESGLGALLRARWAPGPAHLFANPRAAQGGIPGTAAELSSRVDMVQHAGSAMLAWAAQLSREQR